MPWSLGTTEGVKHLQRGLNNAVFPNKAPPFYLILSGVMDPETTHWIREFQRVFDMPQTGECTVEMQRKMEDEMVRKNITQW